MTDDDFYNKNFLNDVILKLESKNLDLIYTFYNFIDEKNKIFFAKNYPYYNYTKSRLKNLSNFILFRNINPIFLEFINQAPLKLNLNITDILMIPNLTMIIYLFLIFC